MRLKQTLYNLIDLFAPKIRDAFLVSIQDINNRAILSEIIKAIENGDPAQAFRAIGFSEPALRPIVLEIEKAFEAGGVLTGEAFPKYLNTPNGRAVFRFDVRNNRAENWLREQSSRLIVNIQTDIETSVKNVLTDNMAKGNNPRITALDLVGRIDPISGNRIGGIIGLAPNQERWSSSYRQKLETLDMTYFNMELRDKRFDQTVLKSIKSGKPLPVSMIDKLVMRYRSNALRYRGESIGRTESIQSLNRSEYEAVLQAADMGAINRENSKREWDSAGDGRVRFSHKLLDGQKVGIDEPFTSPLTGAKMMHPGDISLGASASEVVMCRCRAKLKIDFLAAWND